ncbi:ATP-binding protein [Necropsobacter massiliensis]|uniref:ATP-binding protein n=1 Tax=Necropsobacter massiliensis TaxID=1400001 RepID=UPI000595A428|nr:ATP-binding protein [Necropsobacter massiliensis]
MKNVRYFAKKYVDWVIRLGRFKFSLLGVCVLAVFALFIQILLSLSIVGTVYWDDVARSVIFGLFSAPFVIYFFTLLVERLEKSRLDLAKLVDNLRTEVSERILAERKLSVALNDLERNNRNKTALMTTISHELRTPLNGIIGLSRILLDGPLNEQQRDYLKTISMSAISLGHIFSDIVDLEKIDAKRIELNCRETDLRSFLSDIANFATLMAEQNKLKFEMYCAPDLPDWLMLDSARLSQVLWNLISNAVKFTPQGRVKLDVRRLDAQTFSFAISDTGIGIAPQELENIFTMYYQVKSDSHQRAGSGIGLAISRTIARLMQGDLTVTSEPGKGSTFLFTLRAQEVTKPREETQNIPSTLSILLVEDIEVNIVVAKSVLEKLGYSVDVAMSGQQAIEKFEHNYYDLVLLDIQLPDMSGFDVAAHLRRNYEEGTYDFLPPLIALTANVMQSKQTYRQKGMDDVLRKPLSLDELTHCLQEYFGEEIKPALVLTPQEQNNKWQDDEFLDIAMLNELREILDTEFIKKNVLLFRQTMPAYLDELSTAYRDYQRSNLRTEVASVAHKIKGAAASIGLKRIQHIAAQAQTPDAEQWHAKIVDWIEALADNWQADVQRLEQWLDNT